MTKKYIKSRQDIFIQENLLNSNGSYYSRADVPRSRKSDINDDFRRFQKDFSGLINYEKDQIKYGGKQIDER